TVLPDDLGGIIHISVRGSFLDADHPATGSILHAGSQLFAETAFPHRLSPRLENRLTSNRGLFRGAGHSISLDALTLQLEARIATMGKICSGAFRRNVMRPLMEPDKLVGDLHRHSGEKIHAEHD
ncbi:MAG: hypothetical protein CML68_18850, partial [Rhodobacteraceae bacterium]|nr:hypothetical protein [Paracoccaceae bacterium]